MPIFHKLKEIGGSWNSSYGSFGQSQVLPSIPGGYGYTLLYSNNLLFAYDFVNGSHYVSKITPCQRKALSTTNWTSDQALAAGGQPWESNGFQWNRIYPDLALPAGSRTVHSGVVLPEDSYYGEEMFLLLGDNRVFSSCDGVNWGIKPQLPQADTGIYGAVLYWLYFKPTSQTSRIILYSTSGYLSRDRGETWEPTDLKIPTYLGTSVCYHPHLGSVYFFGGRPPYGSSTNLVFVKTIDQTQQATGEAAPTEITNFSYWLNNEVSGNSGQAQDLPPKSYAATAFMGIEVPSSTVPNNVFFSLFGGINDSNQPIDEGVLLRLKPWAAVDENPGGTVSVTPGQKGTYTRWCSLPAPLAYGSAATTLNDVVYASPHNTYLTSGEVTRSGNTAFGKMVFLVPRADKIGLSSSAQAATNVLVGSYQLVDSEYTPNKWVFPTAGRKLIRLSLRVKSLIPQTTTQPYSSQVPLTQVGGAPQDYFTVSLGCRLFKTGNFAELGRGPKFDVTNLSHQTTDPYSTLPVYSNYATKVRQGFTSTEHTLTFTYLIDLGEDPVNDLEVEVFPRGLTNWQDHTYTQEDPESARVLSVAVLEETDFSNPSSLPKRVETELLGSPKTLSVTLQGGTSLSYDISARIVDPTYGRSGYFNPIKWTEGTGGILSNDHRGLPAAKECPPWVNLAPLVLNEDGYVPIDFGLDRRLFRLVFDSTNLEPGVYHQWFRLDNFRRDNSLTEEVVKPTIVTYINGNWIGKNGGYANISNYNSSEWAPYLQDLVTEHNGPENYVQPTTTDQNEIEWSLDYPVSSGPYTTIQIRIVAGVWKRSIITSESWESCKFEIRTNLPGDTWRTLTFEEPLGNKTTPFTADWVLFTLTFPGPWTTANAQNLRIKWRTTGFGDISNAYALGVTAMQASLSTGTGAFLAEEDGYPDFFRVALTVTNEPPAPPPPAPPNPWTDCEVDTQLLVVTEPLAPGASTDIFNDKDWFGVQGNVSGAPLGSAYVCRATYVDGGNTLTNAKIFYNGVDTGNPDDLDKISTNLDVWDTDTYIELPTNNSLAATVNFTFDWIQTPISYGIAVLRLRATTTGTGGTLKAVFDPTGDAQEALVTVTGNTVKEYLFTFVKYNEVAEDQNARNSTGTVGLSLQTLANAINGDIRILSWDLLAFHINPDRGGDEALYTFLVQDVDGNWPLAQKSTEPFIWTDDFYLGSELDSGPQPPTIQPGRIFLNGQFSRTFTPPYKIVLATWVRRSNSNLDFDIWWRPKVATAAGAVVKNVLSSGEAYWLGDLDTWQFLVVAFDWTNSYNSVDWELMLIPRKEASVSEPFLALGQSRLYLFDSVSATPEEIYNAILSDEQCPPVDPPPPLPPPPLPPPPAPPLPPNPPLPPLPPLPPVAPPPPPVISPTLPPPPPVLPPGAPLVPPPPPPLLEGQPPILPTLPPPGPCAPCPDGVIKIWIDAESLPIQAGGIGARTTSLIQVEDLLPGTYEINYSARRCDQSECISSFKLVVEDPSQTSWPFPEITINRLPNGMVGQEYSDITRATLEKGDENTNTKLVFTAVKPGADGNGITIQYVLRKETVENAAGNDEQLPIANQPLDVQVVNEAITVLLATDSARNIFTTAEAVKNAIRNKAAAAALVTVKGVGSLTGFIQAEDDQPQKLDGGKNATPQLNISVVSQLSDLGFCANNFEGETTSSTLSANSVRTTELVNTDTPEYLWSITPGREGQSSLPPGLSFDALSGSIYGKPTRAGDYLVTVHVTDERGFRTTKQIPITIFPSRPEPRVKTGELRTLPREIYPDEPEIKGVLTSPIADNPVQVLYPASDIKRGYWGPPPLWETLNNEVVDQNWISSSLKWEGEESPCIIKVDTPEGSGPWTEIRVKFDAYKEPISERDFKVILGVRPMSGGVPLRQTVEKSTLPLEVASRETQMVWRGLWFKEDIENLGVRIEPKTHPGLSDQDAQSSKVLVSGLEVTSKAVKLPPIRMETTLLIGGQPTASYQLSPELSDQMEVYSMDWQGHWTKEEIEELSVVMNPRLSSSEPNEGNATIPWIMLSAVEVEVSPEPPPAIPLPTPNITNLFEVEVQPKGAADLSAHTFLVRVTSKGFDGTTYLTLDWIGANPGVTATYSDDRIEITNNETVQVELTITNISAAEGAVARFSAIAVASDGSGSGTSGLIFFYVADPPPDPLPQPVSTTGATEFLLDVNPAVVRCPTSGTTTSNVKITAPLGVTVVTLSATIRPTTSNITATFDNTVTLPSPGKPVTVALRVDASQAEEDTYSVDILAVGADGGRVRTQVAVVVSGPPEFPVPQVPPLPPVTSPNTQTVVEVLVPSSNIRQIGTISGDWSSINNTITSPNDTDFVLFSFGPPPLTELGAIDFGMTDPISDSTWKLIVLRARLARERAVQTPTFTFQPIIDGSALEPVKLITAEGGLSTNPQNFAFTWEGAWTTNQLRSLMVQVAAYTTGEQRELNGIKILELDALIAGELRRPLPRRVPIQIDINEVVATDAKPLSNSATWVYQPTGDERDVKEDVDCSDDTSYATVVLDGSEESLVRFSLEDPPIRGSWAVITARVRAKYVSGGLPGVQATLYIANQIVAGNLVSLTEGQWVNYRHVFSGSWDDEDLKGASLQIRVVNSESTTSTVLISAVDIMAEATPLSVEQVKLIPVAENQVFGYNEGSVSHIYEGLEWPVIPEGADPNDPALLAGALTSPNPLPKDYEEDTVDDDYMIFPLTDEQRSGMIIFDISDPPSTNYPLLPPPPASPPGPPTTPEGDVFYTAITVRMRLHQDPRVVPPVISPVVPEPPFRFVPGQSTNLPSGVVGVEYLPLGEEYIFKVQGGTPPYVWNAFIVETQGENLAGIPPGMTLVQDPEDSSQFILSGTPTFAGTFQWGVSVTDSKGRGISLVVFLQVNQPGPPVTPPVPPPPQPPSPPPPGPPGPPPPGPEVPDLLPWIEEYTLGADPEDPNNIWIAPLAPGEEPPSPVPPLTFTPVQEITFSSVGETIELDIGLLYELAGFPRDQLSWTLEIISEEKPLAPGLVGQIKGVPSTGNPPTEVDANSTAPFTLKLTYFGVSGIPEKGTGIISVTGKPDRFGNPNATGAGSSQFYWSYLSPLVILTKTLPNATLGQAYNEQLEASGGTPPYVWGELLATNSGLPPNIRLNPDGSLTGVPIQLGVYLFRVGVVDSKGQTAVETYSLTVVPFVLPPPPVSPPPPGPVVPPPPGVPPAPPPPPVSPPVPPLYIIEEVPDIQIRFQPIVPDSCEGQLYGLGPYTINGFLVPRPDPGTSVPISEGPWENFEHTWYGFWTDNQLKELLVSVEMELVEPVSPGASNSLYMAALDVIVTKALPPEIVPWPASTKPEGRIKWMNDRLEAETGPLSGKWKDGDTLSWRGSEEVGPAAMESVLGTAHKGGLTQEQANAVLNRYEIYGWLDRDGDEASGITDNPQTMGYAWLGTNIGPLDTELLVENMHAIIDPKKKLFQGFMIDNELIIVEGRYFDTQRSTFRYVNRGANETQAAPHQKGTPIFPIGFWELMYQIKVSGATSGEFEGNAVGYNTPPGTDDGTPGELLQNGPLDLRPFTGDHPIRWLLRLRVVDIFGLTTESDMNLPSRPDMFKSTGSLAYFGTTGRAESQVPEKRVLYVKQVRPPGRPHLYPTQ